MALSPELAMEVKHANKRWTLRQLAALQRSGFHSARQPNLARNTGQLTLSFDETISRVQSIASTIKNNDTGPMEVCVIGLNAAGLISPHFGELLDSSLKRLESPLSKRCHLNVSKTAGNICYREPCMRNELELVRRTLRDLGG
jgi:hypothetical protein